MEKVVIPTINSLISFVLAYKGWHLYLIAGLEIQLILIAIISSITGTILAFKYKSQGKNSIFIITTFLFVICLIGYSYIISLPGLGGWLIFISSILFCVTFVTSFFLVSYFEFFIVKRLQSNDED